MMKYSLQQLLLDIFFPSYCPHCQKAIPGRLLLCEACDRELYAPRFWKPDEESGSHLDGIFRFYHYEGGIKAALHGLKYSKREEYLSRIGEEVLFHRKDLPAFLQDSSAVFALIPTDPTRRAERGYDIPEAIFEPLCRALDLPKKSLLTRTRATRPQYGLSRQERQENMAECFAVADGVPAPATVILGDDICTTRSTLESAAGTLKKAGVKRIYGLVLASGHD